MRDYRLYCLDGGGRIGFAQWIRANNDEDAVDEARRMTPDALQCEVWHRTRLVAKLNSAGQFEPGYEGQSS